MRESSLFWYDVTISYFFSGWKTSFFDQHPYFWDGFLKSFFVPRLKSSTWKKCTQCWKTRVKRSYFGQSERSEAYNLNLVVLAISDNFWLGFKISSGNTFLKLRISTFMYPVARFAHEKIMMCIFNNFVPKISQSDTLVTYLHCPKKDLWKSP